MVYFNNEITNETEKTKTLKLNKIKRKLFLIKKK